jgi:hypothetical protein
VRYGEGVRIGDAKLQYVDRLHTPQGSCILHPV